MPEELIAQLRLRESAGLPSAAAQDLPKKVDA